MRATRSVFPFALFLFLFTCLPAAHAAEALDARYLPIQWQAGTWDAEVTFYQNDQPSGTTRGVQINEPLSNGHWISNRFTIPASGDLPDYQGQGVWGYDPVAGTYVDTWVDSNDLAVRTSYGYWDAAQRTMTWSSKQSDGKGHFVDYRIVEAYQDNTRVFTFYQLGMAVPNPHPLVRIVFTRRPEDDGAMRSQG